MLKLNELRAHNKITAYGFKAFVEFAAQSQGDNEFVVSTLSPAIMADMGISTYYAPVLPRGLILNTADEVAQADLNVNHVTVYAGLDASHFDTILIVSQHQGTIDLLLDKYPGAQVLSGNVTADDICKGFIVGTLPAHLVQYCQSYSAVTIDNFDYTVDRDLSGQELLDRIHISDPITVSINRKGSNQIMQAQRMFLTK